MLACRGLNSKDLSEDADLAGVRDKAWFRELVAAAAAAEVGSAAAMASG